ncbi:hypothetical protein XOO3984 [Xanthomonas oryzae pv. oryzae KACC 10331]|uniref:Uncharacterized protein n=1 Tax=Xanthomonas oryzae pv. oryzae (strain KACC10331 / KXO85) TaxID=291331 RepID=Q5GVN5_XANOR|nr:hypothetical protein XOO3984 [Xanthomonas oryzae pv. oryzae KACC 10331]
MKNPLVYSWAHTGNRRRGRDRWAQIAAPHQHGQDPYAGRDGDAADQQQYIVIGQHIGFARGHRPQRAYALGLTQHRIADAAAIQACIGLHARGDLRIGERQMFHQLTGMIFLAHHLHGAEQGAAEQAAHVLRHAEQHDETDQVARLRDHPADTGHHRRADEERAAEGEQELAQIHLLRAGKAGGIGIHEAADADGGHRDDQMLGHPCRVDQPCARRHPRHRHRHRPQQHQHEQGFQLCIGQAQGLEEADGAGALFGQHQPDQQDRQAEPQHVGAGQPARVDHRVATVVFDPGRRAQQHDGRCQHHAQPRRAGPPQQAAERQHCRKPRRTSREQAEGEEIQRLEHAITVAWRQFERQHTGQRKHRQPALEQVQALPLAKCEQVGGKHPRERQRQLGHAQTKHHCLESVFAWQRLDHVIQAQRTERCAHQPMRGAHGNRRAQAMHEQVRKGNERVQRQEDFGEAAQPELLAKLHQQQVGRHGGHHIGGRQPGHFGGVGAQRALQIGQVGGDQRVAEPAGERHAYAHQPVLNTPPGGVQRSGGRPREGGLLVGLPVALDVLVAH